MQTGGGLSLAMACWWHAPLVRVSSARAADRSHVHPGAAAEGDRRRPGGPGAAALKPSADIPAEWWTLFHSSGLDSMVSEALNNSPTLVQATVVQGRAGRSNASTGATKYPRDRRCFC